MIQSMTGYGKATAIFGEKKINVEIKSLKDVYKRQAVINASSVCDNAKRNKKGVFS